MTEALRNEIIRLRQTGASQRQIARALGISRRSVRRVLDRIKAARMGQTATTNLPKLPARRPSLLDEHEDFIRQLLERYPDITAMRVYEELRCRGFAGRYTIVRRRVRELRPKPRKQAVVRFETS